VLDTANDLIGKLLQGAVEALDIPPSLHRDALAEYQRVGDWLSDHADGGSHGWRVYSQGSFRLGTVVRPAGKDEYDLDAVCVRSIAKQSTTQELLKREVGGALGRYVRSRRGQPGAPTGCEERKRCWTLGYPVDFHLDVTRSTTARSASATAGNGERQTRSPPLSCPGLRSGCFTTSSGSLPTRGTAEATAPSTTASPLKRHYLTPATTRQVQSLHEIGGRPPHRNAQDLTRHHRIL
jgi:Cyclic GMP-AMP synthase DncV-like, nucleotidyltransferase domain